MKTLTKVILCLLLVTAANAVTQEWAAVYNIGGGTADYPKDIAVDSLNNVYVTGFSGSSDGWTVTTVKYDSAGNQLWVRHYDHNPGSNFGDWANAIAVDSSGNVYVTGATDTGQNQEDVLTIKYATNGTFQWASTYNGGANGYDEGHDIAVNSVTGDVYVTGRSGGNLFILRYNSAGVQQFVNIYGGVTACGYGIALNGSGHVYVTGTDGSQYQTIKRTADLTSELWSVAYGSGTAYDIAVDGSGDAYITGMESGDCVTIKYDNAFGSTHWTKTYDGGSTDGGEAIAVDSSGNAYVTGNTDTAGGTDYLTIMYDTSGVQQWAKTYDGGSTDKAHGIAIDTETPVNVYITGESDSASSNWDFATIMYDNAGNEKWVMRYNGLGNNWDKGQAIAVYDKDNIYVTGECTESSYDYATVKYSQAGAGRIVKWEQLPDLFETGIDVNATIPYILADDFNCTTSGPITEITVWGSWINDYLPLENPNAVKFTLSIHPDIPADQSPTGYSMPGDNFWLRTFMSGDFKVEQYATNLEEGWMDPPERYIDHADTICWKYTFTVDPCDAFYQLGTPNEPIVYWLDVQAEPEDMSAKFGWKTSLDHWNDDAVWVTGQEPYNGDWYELIYPPGHEMQGQSIDLAFAIVTEANEPEPEPKDALRHLKWSQPPIEIYPNEPSITFCGWDETSFTAEPQVDWKIVADDFRCLGTMPITSIHWWGSYYNHDSNELPVTQPIAWRIGFWSNIPVGVNPDAMWSHPEILLKQIEIPADRVEIEYIGTDQFPERPSDTCFQYYVKLQPDEIFKQEEYVSQTQDRVFWISIAAVYPNGPVPNNPWGWKTRPWHWMDDAVTFNLDHDPTEGETIDPTATVPLEYEGESYDVSFELDTDPNYIKWEQDFNGIRNWQHYEDVTSTFNTHEQPEDARLVADDWRCLRRTPVTAIAWWGSYIGYRYQACSTPVMPIPIQPDRFNLTIWTDVPAGADPCYVYSHPGEEIWNYTVPKDQYDEVLVGFDKHPEFDQPFRTEPVFRYSVRLPQEAWFNQPDFNEVFWLSIQAIYDDPTPPDTYYPWGWTNHEHVFNDDAVQGYEDPTLGWVWNEVKDQTGASADMSFVLFTDPDECVNCPDYNIDYNVNFIDFADFADDWAWTGPAGGYNNSDLDCNGTVNTADLALFVQVWLDSCP